ncbi:MAG: hypothetical protein Q9199_007447 [Rusavskia elegans]
MAATWSDRKKLDIFLKESTVPYRTPTWILLAIPTHPVHWWDLRFGWQSRYRMASRLSKGYNGSAERVSDSQQDILEACTFKKTPSSSDRLY